MTESEREKKGSTPELVDTEEKNKTHLEEKSGKKDLIAVKTKDDGDCAFHATLGEWDPKEKQFICKEAAAKREQVGEAIRESKEGQPIYNLAVLGIKELIMSRRFVGGKIRELQKNYQKFLDDQLELNTSLSQKLEEFIKKYPDIIEYIEKNHKHNKGNEASLREKFYDALNTNNGKLYEIIYSNPKSAQEFYEYNELMNTEFDFKNLINQDVIKEYANFVQSSGQWLLASEVAIIAHVFGKTVLYYPHANAVVKPFNSGKGQENTISIQFNGVNHFERLISEAEVTPEMRPLKSKAGDSVPEEAVNDLVEELGEAPKEWLDRESKKHGLRPFGESALLKESSSMWYLGASAKIFKYAGLVLGKVPLPIVKAVGSITGGVVFCLDMIRGKYKKIKAIEKIDGVINEGDEAQIQVKEQVEVSLPLSNSWLDQLGVIDNKSSYTISTVTFLLQLAITFLDSFVPLNQARQHENLDGDKSTADELIWYSIVATVILMMLQEIVAKKEEKNRDKRLEEVLWRRNFLQLLESQGPEARIETAVIARHIIRKQKESEEKLVSTQAPSVPPATVEEEGVIRIRDQKMYQTVLKRLHKEMREIKQTDPKAKDFATELSKMPKESKKLGSPKQSSVAFWSSPAAASLSQAPKSTSSQKEPAHDDVAINISNEQSSLLHSSTTLNKGKE